MEVCVVTGHRVRKGFQTGRETSHKNPLAAVQYVQKCHFSFNLNNLNSFFYGPTWTEELQNVGLYPSFSQLKVPLQMLHRCLFWFGFILLF